MKTYIFTSKDTTLKDCYRIESIQAVLEKVAENTNTADLLVAVYLLENSRIWQGHFVRAWLSPADFRHHSGRDRLLFNGFKTPEDLPEQYKLIRMAFGTSARYPRTSENKYGWRERFETFEDHLVDVFAHELHHYRRYHLRLHQGEGEQSACKWALQRAKEAGFKVTGTRIHKQKSQKMRKTPIRIPTEKNQRLLRRIKLSASHLCPEDLIELERWAYNRRHELNRQEEKQKLHEHREKLRALPNGSLVRIISDIFPGKYKNQIATKTRTLKRNSTRLEIKTTDGEEWCWLMRCLEVAE